MVDDETVLERLSLPSYMVPGESKHRLAPNKHASMTVGHIRSLLQDEGFDGLRSVTFDGCCECHMPYIASECDGIGYVIENDKTVHTAYCEPFRQVRKDEDGR